MFQFFYVVVDEIHQKMAIDAKDKIEMARTAEKKTATKPEDFKAVPDKTADGQPSDN